MNLYNLFEAPKRPPAPGTTGVMDNQVQSAASPIGSGTSRWEHKKKPVTMMGVGNNGVIVDEARDVQLDEISNKILGDYKKAAGADASAADARGDVERGNKRFRGIVKATIKQGENDAKRHKQQGVAEAGALDNYRERLGTQGNIQSQNQRHQDWLDAHHQSSLDRMANHRDVMNRLSNAGVDDTVARQEIRRERMRKDDDDWQDTFDTMRDRLNRYQYSSQRDVDPDQLEKISNIKYNSKRKRVKENTGQDRKAWMASIRQQHPTVKFVQAKMPGAPIMAMVNGKPVAQFDTKKGVAESMGRATPKMPKARDPGHAVLAAKRSSGAGGQHTNKKRQALLQPKHQKPLTRDMDMNEDVERHLMQMRHAGYNIK